MGDATAGRSTGKGKEKAHAVSKTSAQRDCAACLEKKPRMYHLASTCKHSYCQDCLSGLFTVASKDDTLLPVRCCKQPIDQTLADELLSGETAREFKQRLREIQTVSLKSSHQSLCANVKNKFFYATVGVTTCLFHSRYVINLDPDKSLKAERCC